MCVYTCPARTLPEVRDGFLYCDSVDHNPSVEDRQYQFLRSAWGHRTISPREEEQLLELNEARELCLIKCIQQDCSSMRKPCPEVFR